MHEWIKGAAGAIVVFGLAVGFVVGVFFAVVVAALAWWLLPVL